MGYYSAISNFKQFSFTVIPATTKDLIHGHLKRLNDDYPSEIDYWFDFEIDEEGLFTMEPVGETGKAYSLEPALKALINVLEELQSPEDTSGLRGIRFNFELWGEEPGDAQLYSSDGKQLLSVEGKMSFLGELKPV